MSLALRSHSIRCLILIFLALTAFVSQDNRNPYVKQLPDGALSYTPDEKGNIIPDFSRVGYHQGDKEIPMVPVVKTVSANETGDSERIIQEAIDEVSARKPDNNGHRGAILLKKGTYRIPNTIYIRSSGVVLRGEGNSAEGTRLIATGKLQRTLIVATGSGSLKEDSAKVKITDAFVPVGTFSFRVTSAKSFKAGDQIIIYRPGTPNWISDLKMDKIEAREGTRQWKADSYHLRFERNITKVEGNTIFIDNPVVMQMEPKYGGGAIYKYSFSGRISEVGIENIYMESEYAHDKDEAHGWTAIDYDKAENCWARSVTSRFFGFGCVNIKKNAKCITVTDSKCFDAKSIITGSRRYSFNIDGQLSLVKNCETTEGRHDYVTGAMVCGPNVFYNSTASNTRSNIGPHHRWAVGTLYDNITSDGAMDVEDRGNYGTGHGWAGVTQVFWNCTAKTISVQSPWVSGKNYAIGIRGTKTTGRYADRPNGEWFGQNADVEPESLYLAQLKARRKAERKRVR